MWHLRGRAGVRGMSRGRGWHCMGRSRVEWSKDTAPVPFAWFRAARARPPGLRTIDPRPSVCGRLQAMPGNITFEYQNTKVAQGLCPALSNDTYQYIEPTLPMVATSLQLAPGIPQWADQRPMEKKAPGMAPSATESLRGGRSVRHGVACSCDARPF